MTNLLPDSLLAEVSRLFGERMGLHYPRDRWRDLQRGLASAAGPLGFKDARRCAEGLVASSLTSQQIEVLAAHLTVKETYFFREDKGLRALEEHVLPRLIRLREPGDRRLRLWSAGCSTGEEPYSLAILLSRILPRPEEWNLTILATDINPLGIRKAREATYGEWSFRGTPEWIKAGYFTRTSDGRHELLPRIRDRVEFSCLNLAEDSYPSLSTDTNAMDIILCRNVLMYFVPEIARRVARAFHRCLVEGGWLLVSATEASHALFSPLVATPLSGATFFRKDSNRAQPSEDGDARPTGAHEESFAPTEVEPPLLPPAPIPHDAAPLPEPRAPETAAPDPGAGTRARQAGGDPYGEAAALYDRGNYAGAAARLEEALSQADRSMGSSESEAGTFALLARSRANQGNLAAALEWCDRALAADKLGAHLHYLRAIILRELGRPDDAIASLRRCLYLDPDLVVAHFSLGGLLRERKRTREARKCFENAGLLLGRYAPEDVLPGSEGIAAGRLSEIVASLAGGGEGT